MEDVNRAEIDTGLKRGRGLQRKKEEYWVERNGWTGSFSRKRPTDRRTRRGGGAWARACRCDLRAKGGEGGCEQQGVAVAQNQVGGVQVLMDVRGTNCRRTMVREVHLLLKTVVMWHVLKTQFGRWTDLPRAEFSSVEFIWKQIGQSTH